MTAIWAIFPLPPFSPSCPKPTTSLSRSPINWILPSSTNRWLSGLAPSGNKFIGSPRCPPKGCSKSPSFCFPWRGRKWGSSMDSGTVISKCLKSRETNLEVKELKRRGNQLQKLNAISTIKSRNKTTMCTAIWTKPKKARKFPWWTSTCNT